MAFCWLQHRFTSKAISYGEYIFDHGWADAYEKAGGRYYPKLLVGVPFTPVPGSRLLVRPGGDAPIHRRHLAEGLVAAAKQLEVSSLHINFPDATDSAVLTEVGLMQRVGTQYHWRNEGYKTFADFLTSLSSRKRKMIRKEREAALRNGLTIKRLTGSDLTPRDWRNFFRFYIDTSERKWGSPYLTREFFLAVGETMADRVLLVMAEQDGKPVAGALNLIGDDVLYGRNWGSDGAYRFLHFEACYYQAIEFAIAHGLKRVEAGAQGPHKLQRGYLPVPTYSAHWIPEPSFRRAVAAFLERERDMIEQKIEHLAEFSPFRHEDGQI